MQLKNKVEAVLFAVGKKINVEEVARLCSCSVAEAENALKEIQKDYDEKNGSLMVSNIENMWKFNVKQEYVDLVRDLIKETDLDVQTMETLAMIAYLSPVLQSEIVNKRTPAVYDHVKQLEEMGFVTKVKKGRSRELKITEKFYDYFDIDKGKVREMFDKFKGQELKIEQQEDELINLEEERKKEQEELQKHIQEKQKPLSLGDSLNKLDGGVEASDVETEYDEMIKAQKEEERKKEERKKELLQKRKEREKEERKRLRELEKKANRAESFGGGKIKADDEDDEDDDKLNGVQKKKVDEDISEEVDILNKDIESLRNELDE